MSSNWLEHSLQTSDGIDSSKTMQFISYVIVAAQVETLRSDVDAVVFVKLKIVHSINVQIELWLCLMFISKGCFGSFSSARVINKLVFL
jgi:hypothetical protein